MNPALMNYLQYQDSIARQNQQPQNTLESVPQNNEYNPFDSGISRAIESARDSLGMTQKQQDKALRAALFNFSNNIQQHPRPAEGGFWDNFRAIGNAIGPGLNAYDQAEEAAIQQNNQLANQILAQQAAEQNRIAQEEERNWKRNFAERELNENIRRHNLQYPSSVSGSINSDFVPIDSKQQRTRYAKDKNASGTIMQSLNEIEKSYKEFRKVSENDFIDPMSPYHIGTASNAAKDFFGFALNNKELKDQTVKRKALQAKIDKFNVELERQIKGGVLSEKMVKRFEDKSILPSLSDRPDIFEAKLDDLMNEIKNMHEAASLSLKYNVHISPYEVQDFKDSIAPNEVTSQGGDYEDLVDRWE